MSEIRKVDRVVDEIAVALRDNECRPSEERAFLLNSDQAIVAAIIQREYGLAEEKAREALTHSSVLLGNVLQAFGDEEGESAEIVLADCQDGILQICKALALLEER